MQAAFFVLCFEVRDDGPTYDLLDVWKMGLTGKGIVVAVVDEGLEKNHQELKQNYVSIKTFFSTVHLASWFNNYIIISYQSESMGLIYNFMANYGPYMSKIWDG